MIFRSALPRIDGAGPYARKVRAALEAMGLSAEEARAWSRIIASASRGVCWPRMVDLILKAERVWVDAMPEALRSLVENSPEGYKLTREGSEWLAEIGRPKGGEGS